MPLNGVNVLCASCRKKCKQFEQVTVVRCGYGYSPMSDLRNKKTLVGEKKGLSPTIA